MNFNYTTNKTYNNYPVEAQLRKSTQLFMPVKLDYGFDVETVYNIYAVCALGENKFLMVTPLWLLGSSNRKR